MFTQRIANDPTTIRLSNRVEMIKRFIRLRELRGETAGHWADDLIAAEADLYLFRDNLYAALKDDFHANAEY